MQRLNENPRKGAGNSPTHHAERKVIRMQNEVGVKRNLRFNLHLYIVLKCRAKPIATGACF